MGAIIGTAIGVLPGVGPVATMALLLPATYFLPAEGALAFRAVNEAGWETKPLIGWQRPKAWDVQGVLDVLNNPRYAGLAAHTKRAVRFVSKIKSAGAYDNVHCVPAQSA